MTGFTTGFKQRLHKTEDMQRPIFAALRTRLP